MTAKISDFGFSSTGFSVQQGRRPGYTSNVRARETFDPEFEDWNGKKTMDLYSYGLLVWQIAADGKIPFEDMDESEIDNGKKTGADIEILMNTLPNDTPTEIRRVITATVRNIPSKRASLSEIKNTLKESTKWEHLHRFIISPLELYSISITLK